MKSNQVNGEENENYREDEYMNKKRENMKKEKDVKRKETGAEDIRRFFKKHDEH